jgi:hypothetical protein
MRSYIGLFFSVLLFLTACSADDAPDGIIKRDRMVNLLTQLHMVDGSMYSIPQSPDSLYKYGTARYLLLFKQYQTDSVQFRKSYQYYAAKPDIMATMYDQIMLNLKNKSDSINKSQYKHAVPAK